MSVGIRAHGRSALGRVVGVILAGGASRRMGVPKHTLRLPDGRTFADAVASALADALSASGSSPRIVLAGLRSDAPPTTDVGAQFTMRTPTAIHELEVIPDRHPGLGPLAGLDAALHALAADADHVLVAPCDMPLLTAELLSALLEPTDAVATVFTDADGRVRPLPMRLSVGSESAASSRLQGADRSLRGLIDQLAVRTITCPIPGALRSVNTPQEHAALLAARPSRSSP